MQKEKTDGAQAACEAYPYNLIASIIGHTDRTVPMPFTGDHGAGLRYVLSILDEREQGVLKQRYREKLPRSKIGECYGITPERVRQIEVKACRKLQRLPNWNYIAYGVAGYLKRVAAQEYSKGYGIGYRTGYQDGRTDAAQGVCWEPGDEEMLNQPIEGLSLSTRAYNCLITAHCKRIGDVVRLRKEQIDTMKHLGKISADEIARAIQSLGIRHSVWEAYLI